jgi:hypothetical protein
MSHTGMCVTAESWKAGTERGSEAQQRERVRERKRHTTRNNGGCGRRKTARKRGKGGKRRVCPHLSFFVSSSLLHAVRPRCMQCLLCICTFSGYARLFSLLTFSLALRFTSSLSSKILLLCVAHAPPGRQHRQEISHTYKKGSKNTVGSRG